MNFSSLFLDIDELQRLCIAVTGEAEAGVFGAEANTNTNSICSALKSESEVINEYWQLLIDAANAMSDYRDLVYRDMFLVSRVGQQMSLLDKVMAASIEAMEAKI